MSFITAARQEGAKALLGAFAHMGKFDSCLKALTVVDVSEGFVRAHLPVTREVCKTIFIACNKSFALKNKYNSILIHIRCFNQSHTKTPAGLQFLRHIAWGGRINPC